MKIKLNKINAEFNSFVFIADVYVFQQYKDVWYLITGNAIIGSNPDMDKLIDIMESWIATKRNISIDRLREEFAYYYEKEN